MITDSSHFYLLALLCTDTGPTVCLMALVYRTNYFSVFWEVLSERVRTGVGWGQNGKEFLEGGDICIFVAGSCFLGFPGSSDG